jgi:uncharacterized protein YqjF (DUF2071 family)
MPDRPWWMGQSWENLLFAHWRVPLEDLRPVVPPELPLDVIEGSAWVGVTPFRVCGLRPRGVPPPPVISRFPELNVRTYVTLNRRPGIYFFSLDAASRPAAAVARRLYRLPYFRARMRVTESGGWFHYASERTDRRGAPAAFAARYRPTTEVFLPSPGTLAHSLTERYCLYTLDARRRVRRGDIHHPPWSLQAAEAHIERNTMAAGLPVALADPPLLHFARRQDVVFWPLTR